MPELTNEDVLKGIVFPHNKWRKMTEDGKQQRYRNEVLAYIHRLRILQMPIEEVKSMISELYWGAFVEHELQVKESTGLKLNEFFMKKAQAELAKEGGTAAEAPAEVQTC